MRNAGSASLRAEGVLTMAAQGKYPGRVNDRPGRRANRSGGSRAADRVRDPDPFGGRPPIEQIEIRQEDLRHRQGAAARRHRRPHRHGRDRALADRVHRAAAVLLHARRRTTAAGGSGSARPDSGSACSASSTAAAGATSSPRTRPKTSRPAPRRRRLTLSDASSAGRPERRQAWSHRQGA